MSYPIDEHNLTRPAGAPPLCRKCGVRARFLCRAPWERMDFWLCDWHSKDYPAAYDATPEQLAGVVVVARRFAMRCP